MMLTWFQESQFLSLYIFRQQEFPFAKMHYVDTRKESWRDISRDQVSSTAITAIDNFSLPSKDKFCSGSA
jgi:hypothetical protein